MGGRCIFVVFFIVISAFFTAQLVSAMSVEQEEGYLLEQQFGENLALSADNVITDDYTAQKFAEKVASEGYCSRKTLIKGGSTTSKYTTRAFGNVFYKGMSCMPDFILCDGDTIKIIDTKRSGTAGSDQIRCVEELVSKLSTRFKVEKKIVCSSTASICKAPFGWDKEIRELKKPSSAKPTPKIKDTKVSSKVTKEANNVGKSAQATTKAEVGAAGKALKAAGDVATGVAVVGAVGSYYVSETDKDVYSCINQNFSRYKRLPDGSYQTRDTYRAISEDFIYASKNYCACWGNIQDRTRCCENIVLWGYTVLDMLKNNDLCNNHATADKYDLCQEYVTSHGSLGTYCPSRQKGCVEERCGKFKTDAKSASNKPKYGRDTWLHKISRFFG